MLFIEQKEKLEGYIKHEFNRDLVAYYKPREGNKIGFDLYCYKFMCGSLYNTIGSSITFQDSELEVEELITCHAYSDEVRHLFFNTDERNNAGYMYCQPISELIEIFQFIKELQDKYCRGI